jgi:hypothetical protein
MTGQEISPGTVVTLTDGRQATVRFIGLTHFATGEWIGVELTDATGKNDGEVQGERYFQCNPGFGMFIRPTAIETVLQQPSRESKQIIRPGPNATASRQSQTGITASIRKSGALPPTAIKRQSTNGTGTPTPAPKMVARPSLRVWPFPFVLLPCPDFATHSIFLCNLVTHQVPYQTTILFNSARKPFLDRRRSPYLHRRIKSPATSLYSESLNEPTWKPTRRSKGGEAVSRRTGDKNIKTRISKRSFGHWSIQAPFLAASCFRKGL